MTSRLRRIIIILLIQLGILGVIIFFPEAEKSRRFGIEILPPRTIIRMDTLPTGEAVLDAMNKADLFDRYRFTRAVGSESPGTALLILPDLKYAEYWHMEVLLREIQNTGMGALLLDLKDTGEFISLRSENGILRTTEERYALFADASARWLKSLGFTEIVLLSMGNGAVTAWELANRTPDAFSGWVDISGRFGAASDLVPDYQSLKVLPPFLFFAGNMDPQFPELKKLADMLIFNGIDGSLHVLPNTGSGLLNPEGRLDLSVEETVRDELLLWAVEISSHYPGAGQPPPPE